MLLDPLILNLIYLQFYEKRLVHYTACGKEGQKWLTKAEAVILAASGRLHAIIVHAKKGSYLRPEFHAKAFRDLVYSR